MKNIFKKGDIYVVIILLIIGCIGFFILKIFVEKDGCKVVVYIDGQIYAEYNIYDSIQDEIIVDDNSNILVIRDGEVYVEDASCKDKICVNHRHISKSGETIICLPHKFVIEIQ